MAKKNILLITLLKQDSITTISRRHNNDICELNWKRLWVELLFMIRSKKNNHIVRDLRPPRISYSRVAA